VSFPKAIKKFLRLRLGLKPVFDYAECRTRLAGVRALPIGTVFDVGGNVGKMARSYRKMFPGARIYSFEPVPANYAKLAAYAATQNGVVQTFNVAVGSAPGQTTMWWDHAHCGGSSLVRSTFGKETGEEVPVAVETLDRLAAKLEVRGEILVKIDTEGYDLEVIRGGKELLRRATVVIVEVIFADDLNETPHLGQFTQELGELGFMFRGFLGCGYVEGVPMGGDAIFIKRTSLRAAAKK
jgi:FkbM family methyltransferase